MLTSLNVDRFLSNKPLAITMSGLEELRGHIMARLAAFDASPRDFLASVAADMRAAVSQQQRPHARGVGVISIRGSISQHERGDISELLFGGATTEGITRVFREFLADEDVGKIVLDIDSPGGVTYGLTELAQEIRASRGKKPIIAVANSVAASAAYWIGAQADRFYATPGGDVGSIGIYVLHMDYSAAAEQEGVKPTYISAGEFKTELNRFEPLGDEARAYVQESVNETYGVFVADVAAGRGTSEAAVLEGYGKGRVLTAKQAKAAGMIDGIMTLEQAISRDEQPATFQQTEPVATLQPVEVEASVDEEGRKRLARMRWQEVNERAAAV